MDSNNPSKPSREEVRQYFFERFSKYIESPETNAPVIDAPELASALRGAGSEVSEWHFAAFAEIDDLVCAGVSTKNDAIEEVRSKYAVRGHAHNFDSFQSMYYEFKRKSEVRFRTREFAEHLLDGRAEDAIEHLFRLSKRIDIDKLFRGSE